MIAAVLVRLLPVVLLTAAVMAYVVHVEGRGAYAASNLAPMVIFLVLAAITLYKGGGSWVAAGWRWLLGTFGFAIPALGLSLYLHYGYANDLNGMYSEAIYPAELFRFLPLYTMVAGALGFAIGWIAGRNV
ncbi:MAG: hypothetical protein HKN35_14890 [Woeseia sp.]|nr:hypothetical protein [Woeseia sp.]MBT8096400.1 hypothetical protein [Woeseia sp.]NNE62179.1 hypothetical protein [Woeseia sp.]NNL54022.1 hypothetical protein [Woeseia sp.]